MSTSPFRMIDYKECVYCSNTTADIEHVLLECRETKSLRDAYIETMNDKCCEFRLAENKKKRITMMLELKFDVKNNVNAIDELVSRTVAFVNSIYMHVQRRKQSTNGAVVSN